MKYRKAGVCLMLAFALIGCNSRPTVTERREVSDRPAQTKGNPIPAAATSAAPSSAPEAATGEERKVVYRNLGGGVRSVGSKVCASCHQNIYGGYMRTPHGQAASLPSQRPELHDLPSAGVTICEQDAVHCFKVYRENGNYYMSEFELGPNGAHLSKETQKIAYALGEPMAGVGYVIQRDNYLFETPLSYFAGNQDQYQKGWGLSPGYQNDPLGFDRPLIGSCMYCHVGRPLVIDDANNLYKNPPFGELTIGCENCHGPGGLHVDEQRKHVPIAGKIDTSIVDPAYLSPRLRDDICMYCHEFGNARVPQPGKKFEDFLPGTPLLGTMAIFKTRLLMGWNMMEWSEELTQSKCYRDSGGRLTCTTCHDSHYTPTTQEAPAFYRSKCLTCHKGDSCRLSLNERHRSNPPDNCVSCHMQKHVTPRFIMLGTQGTSHRIVAREEEPLPKWAAQLDSPDPGTGLILVDKTEGSARPSVSPIVLLQAYEGVLARSPNQMEISARYDSLLDRLARSDPNNVVVLRALAKRELGKGSPEGNSAALSFLMKAVDKGSKSPQDYMLLAGLLFRSGQSLQALKVLKQAVSLFPYIPTFYEDLSMSYMSIGDVPNAKKIVEIGLGKFPSDPNLEALQRKLEPRP